MTRSWLVTPEGLVEITRATRARAEAPAVLPDLAPYTSMIDGTTITSRSWHREHLRQHGCVEVGTDLPRVTPAPPAASARKGILREQLATMRHAEATRLLRTWRRMAETRPGGV